jgi:alkylhydroperoxidase/carboxymuconolactone decarboxylase family protein YurZ
VNTSSLDLAEAIGRHEAAALGGPGLTEALERLGGVHPELSRFILGRSLGDAAVSSVVDYRESAMLALAALVTLGDTSDQLQVYARAALRHGSTEEELRDVLMLASVYTRAPRAVTARAIADLLTPGAGRPLHKRIVRLADHETGVVDSRRDGDPRTPVLLMHALCIDHHRRARSGPAAVSVTAWSWPRVRWVR